MKNSTLKIIAVLLGLATCLTAFAACSGEDDESKLIYKEGGKLYYRKAPNEAAYELVTDANGETVVDEQGNLLWKITNAAGEDQTHAVSYPDLIMDGKEISCQQFTITMPRGWKSKNDTRIMIYDENDGLTIDYSFFEADEEGNIPTAESRVEELSTLLKPGIDEGKVIMEVSDTQISGRDAKKVVIKSYGKKDAYLEVYYISIRTGTMTFSCSCPYDDGGKIDFKAILDTIEYRI